MQKMLRNLVVVEDNDEDFVALTRVLRTEPGLNIARYRAGEDLIVFLDRVPNGDAASSTESMVILLDLNLPRMNGHEVLSHIKSTPSLKAIPVVILSTSTNPRDIKSCYAQGANGYMVKSVNFTTFEASVRKFSAYWEKAMVLPGDTRSSAHGIQ